MVKRKRVTTTPVPGPLKKLFAPRDVKGEQIVLHEFLAMGIDVENISYLNQSNRNLLAQDDSQVCLSLFN